MTLSVPSTHLGHSGCEVAGQVHLERVHHGIRDVLAQGEGLGCGVRVWGWGWGYRFRLRLGFGVGIKVVFKITVWEEDGLGEGGLSFS